jgi:hypothetical protein
VVENGEGDTQVEDDPDAEYTSDRGHVYGLLDTQYCTEEVEMYRFVSSPAWKGVPSPLPALTNAGP